MPNSRLDQQTDQQPERSRLTKSECTRSLGESAGISMRCAVHPRGLSCIRHAQVWSAVRAVSSRARARVRESSNRPAGADAPNSDAEMRRIPTRERVGKPYWLAVDGRAKARFYTQLWQGAPRAPLQHAIGAAHVGGRRQNRSMSRPERSSPPSVLFELSQRPSLVEAMPRTLSSKSLGFEQCTSASCR